MHSLSWVRSAAAVISDATPLGGPSTGSGDVSISTVVRLSLTELEPLARARPARLLPLDDPRIARQQSLLPQLLPVPFVRQAQRPRDREAHRPRLPRHPAAPAQRPHVEGAERVRRRERLLDVRHERRPGKVVAQRPPVDVPRSEEHTSELQSQSNLVCRLLLEKKKKRNVVTECDICWSYEYGAT